MAYFIVTVTPDANDGTKATVSATFSGGASDYSYQRLMYITIDGYSAPDGGSTVSILSNETGGGTSTFTYELTGLTPGTVYSWSASLYVRVTGGWSATDYTDSGSFAASGGTSAGSCIINTGSAANQNWRNYIPYINIGSAANQNWRPYRGIENHGSAANPNWR